MRLLRIAPCHAVAGDPSTAEACVSHSGQGPKSLVQTMTALTVVILEAVALSCATLSS